MGSMMKQSEKIAAVSDMLAQALIANNHIREPQADDILAWIEARSANLAAALDGNKNRAHQMTTAINRAIRAYKHWVKEGKPGKLQDRMRPAARQMLAIMR